MSEEFVKYMESLRDEDPDVALANHGLISPFDKAEKAMHRVSWEGYYVYIFSYRKQFVAVSVGWMGGKYKSGYEVVEEGDYFDSLEELANWYDCEWILED